MRQTSQHALSKVSKAEVKEIINNLNQRKDPGFDLIIVKTLKEPPNEGLKLITFIFNAVLRRQYLPIHWKVAQVIFIQKPGKPAHETSS